MTPDMKKTENMEELLNTMSKLQYYIIIPAYTMHLYESVFGILHFQETIQHLFSSDSLIRICASLLKKLAKSS